jgi:hypothetical protein
MCMVKSNILLEDGRPVQSLDVPGHIHCTVPGPEMISRPGAIRKLVYSVSARTLAVRP